MCDAFVEKSVGQYFANVRGYNCRATVHASKATTKFVSTTERHASIRKHTSFVINTVYDVATTFGAFQFDSTSLTSTFLEHVSLLRSLFLFVFRIVEVSCNEQCAEIYDPVCASNGKTYENVCVFGYRQCLRRSKEGDSYVELLVLHKGECAGKCSRYSLSGFLAMVCPFPQNEQILHSFLKVQLFAPSEYEPVRGQKTFPVASTTTFVPKYATRFVRTMRMRASSLSHSGPIKNKNYELWTT